MHILNQPNLEPDDAREIADDVRSDDRAGVNILLIL